MARVEFGEGRIMQTKKVNFVFRQCVWGSRRNQRGRKKICATLPDCVSAGKQGLVWGRWRGNNMFPEFSQRKWHFLERERELFSSPTTAPSAPFPSPPPPAAPLRAFGIPGLAVRADISLQTFFYWAVLRQGRARENLRSCWARGGGRVLTPACKHTLPPPLHRDRVHFFFTLLSIFILFSVCIQPLSLPILPLSFGQIVV